MEWIGLCKELFMGGLTGYITNDYAVKMLFRKYGPFGGVILKTKDQFIDKISKLVEEDLINQKTLQPELSGPAFKNIMTTIIGEIIHQTLAEHTPDISIGKIPGFDEFAGRLTSFINTHQQEAVQQLLNPVFANTPYLKVSSTTCPIFHQVSPSYSIQRLRSAPPFPGGRIP